MFYKVKNFFTFLSKLYSYGKLLWEDRDWDYAYIFSLLQHKLKRTRECLSSAKIGYWEKDAKRIRTCELLLDRLIEDKYNHYENLQFDKKWDEFRRSWSFNEVGVEIRKEHWREFTVLVKSVQYLRKQDKDLLFKMLNKYIEGWWN